jgi:SAM-dependent methyltransferase
MSVMRARYDSIGHGYASLRREDPRFASLIMDALGEAKSVVNVGAGAGSYEPRDRRVLAIEPSGVMAAQRPEGSSPVVRGDAQRLPLRDASVDAAMAILSVHHWGRHREEGVRELRRVARGPIVILTCDSEVSSGMWLMKDYLPEVAELDGASFPSLESLTAWLGGETRFDVVPIPRDTSDWMLMSFWAHPERVLDAAARRATSGFARMPPHVVERVVRSVERDLGNGVWEGRYGHLRRMREYDAGLRLVVSTRR